MRGALPALRAGLGRYRSAGTPVIRSLRAIGAALAGWLRPAPRPGFAYVLDRAIEEVGTTRIRLRAYELAGATCDSHEREEKRV